MCENAHIGKSFEDLNVKIIISFPFPCTFILFLLRRSEVDARLEVMEPILCYTSGDWLWHGRDDLICAKDHEECGLAIPNS